MLVCLSLYSDDSTIIFSTPFLLFQRLDCLFPKGNWEGFLSNFTFKRIRLIRKELNSAICSNMYGSRDCLLREGNQRKTNITWYYLQGKWKLLGCIQFFSTPWTVACQAPLSMQFSWPGYWSGWCIPSLSGLPNPGIEPGSPKLQADCLPAELPEKCFTYMWNLKKMYKWAYLQKRKRVTDVETNLWLPGGK